MKVLLVLFVTSTLSGCGFVDKLKANWTGDATTVCMDGVAYYQFTSGSAVAYEKNGQIKTCN